MIPTEHDENAMRYLDEACQNLTRALGAFVTRHRELPEQHKRLLDLSQEADDLAEELRETFEK